MSGSLYLGFIPAMSRPENISRITQLYIVKSVNLYNLVQGFSYKTSVVDFSTAPAGSQPTILSTVHLAPISKRCSEIARETPPIIPCDSADMTPFLSTRTQHPYQRDTGSAKMRVSTPCYIVALIQFSVLSLTIPLDSIPPSDRIQCCSNTSAVVPDKEGSNSLSSYRIRRVLPGRAR